MTHVSQSRAKVNKRKRKINTFHVQLKSLLEKLLEYSLLRHILKAGLDPGPWTLDSGLWTLDFSSQNFTFPPPKKPLYLPPTKLPFPQKNSFPQIKNSTTSDFFLINKLEVCEISNKQLYPPHPPPRKNLHVSPLKLPPPLPK